MTEGSNTLLYYPRRKQLERVSPQRPLSSGDAFGLHRSLGRELGFGTAYVEIGADLLPVDERPAHGKSIKLLWLPLVPSKCLLTAEDATGVLRIVPRDPASEELACTLEHLEVECAWAHEEGLKSQPDKIRLVDHLDAALEHALLAILLFSDQVGPRPFWKTVATTTPPPAAGASA